jgi:hypothetical protein
VPPFGTRDGPPKVSANDPFSSYSWTWLTAAPVEIGLRCRAAPSATVVGSQLVCDWLLTFEPSELLSRAVTHPSRMSLLPLYVFVTGRMRCPSPTFVRCEKNPPLMIWSKGPRRGADQSSMVPPTVRLWSQAK